MVFIFLLCLQSTPSFALPIPDDDKKAIDLDTVHHKINSCTEVANNQAAAGPNSGIPSDGSVWKSGINPPFIMEQFAIETLKAIAKKRGVPETDTVTQEHIDALLAFMFGEGGDIANRWVYNPLNTGLRATELIDGVPKGNGTQSFKSFDAGVEATARTMVGSNQSRLADVLIKKESTAQEFMFALTYFNLFPGNKLWAEASVPNPRNYYTTRIQLIGQVRKKYVDIASTVMGTSAKEYSAGIRNKAALKSQSGTNSSTSALPLNDTTSCASELGNSGTGGIVVNNIAQTAVNFAWPEKHNPPKTPKPEYAAAILQYNSGQRADGADCGVFVATVMHASKADPNYPPVGTSAQRAYIRNHPEKYDIVEGPASTGELLPGDILVADSGGTHHTFIYVGPQGGEKNYDTASASQDQRSANLGKAGWENLKIYTRARLK